MANENLNYAKKNKNDEFYSQLIDIEKEMRNYPSQFLNKTIYCNCDDYRKSNFVKYFHDNFSVIKIKKLIATGYNVDGNGICYIYDGISEKITELNGHGDFRDDECRALLTEADVVVTNPPFSLFREFIALMMEFNKKFLIIGNKNAITYKEVFPLIQNNQLWCGVTMQSGGRFILPSSDTDFTSASYKKVGDNNTVVICGGHWFTNIVNKQRNLPLDLYKHYNPTEYPKYDNYDAIECGKTSDIPMDYDGVIGVPITFLDKYCPDQFEILGLMSGAKGENLTNGDDGRAKFYINNKGVYARILIRHKK